MNSKSREVCWQRYPWPGNVRELQNVIQRIVVFGSESVVTELMDAGPLPSRSRDSPSMPADVIEAASTTPGAEGVGPASR